MNNITKSQICFKSTMQNQIKNNPFAQFQYDWMKNMNSIGNSTSNFQQPIKQNNEQKVEIKQNTLTKDTFDKKEKTKKIIKYGAIGAGIAAVAYSAFALIKYKNISGFANKLAEPIKVLMARINPNGFKPSVSIEEEELDYVVDVVKHLNRLTEKQKSMYIQNLYESSRFNENAQNIFRTHFERFLK